MTLRTLIRTAITGGLVPIIGAAQPPQPSLTLRVNSQLVEVSVVVKDSHGNPVTDLKASDFELYDRGRKQEIRVFKIEKHNLAGQPTPLPAPEERPSTPAGTFTNRTSAEPDAPNAPTVLLIDAGNTWDIKRMTWPDLVYARDQVIQFLRQVHPEDRLGIYLMGADRFWVLHEYNQTCADLLERLASWTGTAAPGSIAAKLPDVWTEFAVHFAHVDDETAKAIHNSQFGTSGSMGSSALPEEGTKLSIQPHRGVGSSDSLGQEAPTPPVGGLRGLPAQPEPGAYLFAGQITPITLLAMVANHLASVPGRKNVILISGKTFLPAQFQDQVTVLRKIIQDGVAVYAIDPGGLAPYNLDAKFVIPSSVILNASRAPIGRGGRVDTKLAAENYMRDNLETNRQITLSLQSSLRTLAEATGGEVFVNTNGIRDAIRSSFDDSRVTYTLGFYPQTSGDDGSFHPIKLKLPDHEHLSVHYRTGYFEPAPPSRDPKQMAAEMNQAVWSPVDASAIELNGSVVPLAGWDDWELKLNIGLARISLQTQGDRWSGKIEVAVVQRDDFGNEYERLLDTFGLMLKTDTYNKAVNKGVDYGRSFKLDPKATSLRVVVRDVSSGNLGTLTIPCGRNGVIGK